MGVNPSWLLRNRLENTCLDWDSMDTHLPHLLKPHKISNALEGAMLVIASEDKKFVSSFSNKFRQSRES